LIVLAQDESSGKSSVGSNNRVSSEVSSIDQPGRLCNLYIALEACISLGMCNGEIFNCIPASCDTSPNCSVVVIDTITVTSSLKNMTEEEKKEEMKVMQCLYNSYSSFASQFSFCYGGAAVSDTITSNGINNTTGILISNWELDFGSSSVVAAKSTSVFGRLPKNKDAKPSSLLDFNLQINVTDINGRKGALIGDGIIVERMPNTLTICSQKSLTYSNEFTSVEWLFVDKIGYKGIAATLNNDMVCGSVDEIGTYFPAYMTPIKEQQNSESDDEIYKYIIVGVVVGVVLIGCVVLIVGFIAFQFVMSMRKKKPEPEIAEVNVLGGTRNATA